MTHPAWLKAEEEAKTPRWVPIAPGIRFLMRRPLAETHATVQAAIARDIASLQEGRAVLERLGFDEADMGELADLNVLAGLSVLLAAIGYAEILVDDWEGVDDAATGEPVSISRNDDTARSAALVAAMRIGTPEGLQPLAAPFMAWLDQPRAPIAAEVRRLRELGKWEFGGGLEHCKGCTIVEAECRKGGGDEAGARCPRHINAPRTTFGRAALDCARTPGLWERGGMGGHLTGIRYVDALHLADVAQGGALDARAFVECLHALENGALEAQAERAAAEE